ncbi:DUF2889 domain-containing protein [Parafrankia discariae]|uniref:DUF2889 domain-containing protein n=1 Tax=Parafrankia discariae TaxID=365528 RepID=UPI001E452BEC|nr:DUF2889 domain-containing protein [Parafrankia discariae]
MIGRGRDLVTGLDGAASVIAEAMFRFEIAFQGRREILRVETVPEVPALAGLVGVSSTSGFRRHLAEIAPELRTTHPLFAALLDDAPVTSLVSGYATTRMGLVHGNGRIMLAQADQCAGWARDATIIGSIEDGNGPPMVTGPPAPSVLVPADPMAWHELAGLPPHGMRRARRLDLLPTGVDELRLDVFFRDSYQSDGGPEAVIHEYEVNAALDSGTLTFTEIESTPRVLPWVECPLAAASAARLAGTAAADARQVVGTTFRGTSTCTHLNDTLRSLGDVPALVAMLPGRSAHQA